MILDTDRKHRTETIFRNNQNSFKNMMQIPSWQKLWEEVGKNNIKELMLEVSKLERRRVELAIKRQTKTLKAADEIIKRILIIYYFKLHEYI